MSDVSEFEIYLKKRKSFLRNETITKTKERNSKSNRRKDNIRFPFDPRRLNIPKWY